MEISKGETDSGLRWSFDGETFYRFKNRYTQIDDWRDTPIGRINFGMTVLHPAQVVEVEQQTIDASPA